LLLISAHAASGTSSTTTFSIVVTLGSKKGLALVESGSTDTFMDYTFANKSSCHIEVTASKKVKVAGGGYLDSTAVALSASYMIHGEKFNNDFKLLQLKGYDVILGCDWIKQHSPIALDLREDTRSLIIQKNGISQVVLHDFTSPNRNANINANKLSKLCRGQVLGYIVQVNSMQHSDKSLAVDNTPPPIAAVLSEFADVFSEKTTLPPLRESDHHIPLKEGAKPPNVRPYRVPHKQKDEVKRLIKTMLEQSTIRPSNSPYSSPTILVRKKDGS
jgi:hypothetical protein